MKGKILSAIALIAAITMSGCVVSSSEKEPDREESSFEREDISEGAGDAAVPEAPLPDPLPDPDPLPGGGAEKEEPDEKEPEESAPQEPVIQTVKYIKVTGDSVNIRSGAGTGYSSKGVAEKNTLYAYLGQSNGWVKTYYKNSTAYISAKYCTVVEMKSSGDDDIENVIAEGSRYMGVKYVYGAVRYHDGKGNKLKGFTNTAFDCSSLMQYIFCKGANKLLDVNTRTQIYQGTTVKKSDLKRGDLIFFTNDSRKNNTGIERVGHVALYLGDNLILHTASDYAKIEEISAKRWGYYIQAQRML